MQKNNEHIFLIGMMGSGKTSVGKFLSKQLNIPVIDSDSYIIENLKISMNIFEYLSKIAVYTCLS